MSNENNSHFLDRIQNATSARNGIHLAHELQYWMRIQRTTLAPDSNYLTVGAGLATGEMAFAQTLGIDQSYITLLDKNLPEGIQGIQADIFTFLDQQARIKYDLVSAFSMEYVLTEKRIGLFLEKLKAHLNQGAHIIIHPYEGKTIISSVFNKYFCL